ncbi:MAG TPA: 16S rRNA (uracil(1498)-N(3))-methyltransferase [Candidatus Eremiobacteraceae bacterium]|nr:16S rRNA (uracil(1498)-N(3))-methyltransferase [Candidatus Eremiobacteraceae bacterium]
MSTPRFFVAVPCTPGAEIALGEADSHHLATVLRATPGDRIVVIDGRAAWDADIASVTARAVLVRVLGETAEEPGELPGRIHVLQALCKGPKFDGVVEKTVELGAASIVPVRFERSETEGGATKVERWRRIAHAAARQSRRRTVPPVEEVVDARAALARFATAMPLIVAWERAPRESLTIAVERCIGVSEFAAAIGPEGSFTDDEIAFARELGATLVSLGPTTLRTETAAAALIAAIAARCGWW